MNKRTLTAAIFLGLIVLATLNYPETEEVQAQLLTPDQPMPEPYQTYYETYKPETTPIEIRVSSPQNNSITDKNSISLAFNVTGPQGILAPEPARIVRTQLTSVSVKGDWQTEEQELYAYDFVHSTSDNKGFDFLEFNTTLSDIPEGTHEVEIMVFGIVNTNAAMFGFEYYYGSNASVTFIVGSIQPTQVSQNSDVSPINPAVIILSLLLICTLVTIIMVVKKKKAQSAKETNITNSENKKLNKILFCNHDFC